MVDETEFNIMDADHESRLMDRDPRRIQPPASPALLPCPFCGGLADVDQFSQEADDWQALCEDLCCRGGTPLEEGWSTGELALQAWNKRADNRTGTKNPT